MQKMGMQKAIVAFVATAASVAAAMFGVGELPPDGEVQAAIVNLAAAIASGLATGGLVWLKANKPKKEGGL